MSAEIDLGEHGVHGIGDVRFRDALVQGHLLAYIRHEAEEHPRAVKVAVATIAIGVVATGIAGLKHRRK